VAQIRAADDAAEPRDWITLDPVALEPTSRRVSMSFPRNDG
jgi:hypothetical protein